MGLGKKLKKKGKRVYGRGKEKREGERKGKRDLEVDLFRAPKHSIILLKSKKFLRSLCSFWGKTIKKALIIRSENL